MINYLSKTLVGATLLFAVSCASDTESLEETDLASTGTSLLSEPDGDSRVRPVKGSTYYIKNVSTGNFLDVSGVSKKSGANVHLWDFTGSDNQKWKITGFGDNARLTAKHSNMSLDVKDWSKNDGGNIHQWTQTQGVNQKWTIVSTNDGTNRFYIKSIHSNLHLANGSFSDENGVNVEQNNPNLNYYQWAFYKTN